MAEWFFRKKSKGEVERDPGWDEYFTSNRSTGESIVRGKGLTDLANQWKEGDDFRVVLKRPNIGGVRAASATTSNTSSKTSRYTGRIAPLQSDLEAACEGLTGNARKIMQVIAEDPGITIESLATLVKLTPYGIRYHLSGLAKSVGLHHSNDRKGGVWEVSGPKKRVQEATQRSGAGRHPVGTQSRHPVKGPSQRGLVKGPSQEGLVEGASQGLVEGASQGLVKVLYALVNSEIPLSSTAIAKAFGKDRANSYIKRLVASLVDDGIAETTGERKRGARLQKYRLTAKGRKLAATLAKNAAKSKGKGRGK